MSKEATISVIIRKDKEKSDGKCPLQLRITKNRKRNYVSLGISILPELWDEAKEKPKAKHPEKIFIEGIIESKKSEYNRKMLELQDMGKDFTSETLRDAVEQPTVLKTVWSFYDEEIARRKKTNPKTANYYVGSRNSLRNFHGNKDLLFSDIDSRFLRRYEDWMQQQNLKETSMSAYLRALRTLFNLAIDEKIVKREFYPFESFKISKLNTETRKRAITKEEMYKIIDLPLEPNSRIWQFRQYFVFMYFGQGINFKDLALLTWQSLDNDRIQYVRSKTSFLVNCKLSDYGKSVVESFRPITGSDNGNYIFTILDKNTHIAPQQIQDRLDKVLKQMNKYLKEIGSMINLPFPLTTYVARHTYATVLKNSGADVSKISQAMAHTNLRTTQVYFKAFEDTTIDEMNEKLL